MAVYPLSFSLISSVFFIIRNPFIYKGIYKVLRKVRAKMKAGERLFHFIFIICATMFPFASLYFFFIIREIDKTQKYQEQ
jgi:hypothetical protein